MKPRNFSSLIFPLAATLLFACGGGGQGGQHVNSEGDTLHLRHAQLLTIVEYEDYTTVDVADPWNKGKTLHHYRIEKDHPVKSALVTTSVHCGLFDELGCREMLTGVCDLQYIHLPWVQQGCKDGSIADCGNSLEPTVELIAKLQPDAIFLSPFQNSGGYGRVEQLGIEIVEMADYMETSALGRAEWMRFYARLLGQKERGDSLFAVVEQSYNELKVQAETGGETATTLLMDKMVGQVWYVPGGSSTTGRMLSDAGAAYPWADDNHSGSLALSLEEVLDKGADADVWVLRYSGAAPLTLRSLLKENVAYSQFKAFQNGMVYGCNTETSTFFEETPFHPERLLRDLVCIVHPNQGVPHYYHRVE